MKRPANWGDVSLFEGCGPSGFAACRPREHDDLEAAGFEPRFVADPRMVTDAVATYEELGYEVRVLLLDPDRVEEECSGCAVKLGELRAVYTRRKGER